MSINNNLGLNEPLLPLSPLPLTAQEQDKVVDTLFGEIALTATDIDSTLKLIKDLANQIATDDSEALVPKMHKLRKGIDSHWQEFTPQEKTTIQAIFSKNLLINGKTIQLDPYQCAYYLRGLSTLFIGNLENGPVNIEHFEAIKIYMETKGLPQEPDHLLELSKAADKANYKKMHYACADKILSGDNPLTKRELLEYALDSNNKKLAAKCLPHILNQTSIQGMIPLLKRANECLPKEWILGVKDLSVTATLLQIQHENGLLNLEQLWDILTEIIGDDSLCLNLKGKGLELTICELDNHELLQMFSKIKALKHVIFNCSGEVNEHAKNMVFPYVERVDIETWFVTSTAQFKDSINFSQLFPNAKSYGFQATDDAEAIEILGKIQKNTPHLYVIEMEGGSPQITDRTASMIANKFKKLESFTGWKKETSITYQGFMHILLTIIPALYKNKEAMRCITPSSPYWT